MLTGGEVKSVRAGHVDFKDAFARLDKGEVFLYNLHIRPYEQASYMNDEPDRPRKLLLHKREIQKLTGRMAERGLTLVPTKVKINDRGFVKVEVALGKGKKHFDKRESIKKRTLDRALGRTLRKAQKRHS